MTLDAARLLPYVINVDDSDTPADLIDAFALAPFTAGTQPHSSSTRLAEVRPEATLLPREATVVRSAKHNGGEAILAAGRGWTIHVARWNSGGGGKRTAEDACIAPTAMGQYL